MKLLKKPTLITVSITVLLANIYVKANIINDAKGFKISGGENHTLVVTKNKSVFACGPNGDSYYGYYGVLGTGSNSFTLEEWTLVPVHDGQMETDSNCLEGIDDISAGWTHSLALDIDKNVWAWDDSQFWTIL